MANERISEVVRRLVESSVFLGDDAPWTPAESRKVAEEYLAALKRNVPATHAGLKVYDGLPSISDFGAWVERHKVDMERTTLQLVLSGTRARADRGYYVVQLAVRETGHPPLLLSVTRQGQINPGVGKPDDYGNVPIGPASAAQRVGPHI